MARRHYHLDWRGEDVLRNLLRASVLAVEETMIDAVVDAKADVPFRTGAYHDSIRTSEDGVQVEGDTIVRGADNPPVRLK